MLVVAKPNPTVDKLILLAEGDWELVQEAMRYCAEYKRWRWWHRKPRYGSGLEKVVAYIVSRLKHTPHRAA